MSFLFCILALCTSFSSCLLTNNPLTEVTVLVPQQQAVRQVRQLCAFAINSSAVSCFSLAYAANWSMTAMSFV